MLHQFNRHLLSFFIIFFIVQINLTKCFQCEKDGFFPDKRDCWVYHICVGTTHTVKTCKEDLLFNPIKNQCDWAINVNCTAQIPEGRSLNGHNNNNSPLDDLCQTVDNDYIAHPTDCKQYAYCANGMAQKKICKKTLLWSQSEKMCVWPAQSDCPVKTSTTPKSSTTQDTSPTTYPSTSSIPRTNHSQSSTICPLDQSKRLPDPYDCSIYHDCYHGTDLISYCPINYQYNPKKQTCDLTENVQCKNKCTVKNEGARFIDSTSCCHYYQCLSGQLALQSCPQSYLFDMQIRTCLPYKKVRCDGRRTCLTKCHYDIGKNSCDALTLCVGHNDGYYLDRHKPNCQYYIQCLDHRVVNYSRCSYGQRFNRNLGRCTFSDQVPCRASLSNRISWMILFLLIVLHMNNHWLR